MAVISQLLDVLTAAAADLLRDARKLVSGVIVVACVPASAQDGDS